MSVYILKRIILSLVLFVLAVSSGPAALAADLRAEEIITVLPKDGIPAILSPSFEDGNKISWLKGKDAVIGVSIKGDSRAYSVAILSSREIVNDRVGGVPIAVTWWPLCYTAIVYDRRVGGKELTFGVSGKLHANSLIMYDHQTDSLWSHLVGAAVTGPLKGKKLKPLSSMFTRWNTWQRLHPNSKVLKSGRPVIGSLRDPYEADGYYSNPQRLGIIPTRRSDNRIHPKEYVLGLVLDDKAKAYPFSRLSRERVVNDTFQGNSLLVVFDPEAATGVVFNRKLGGNTLSFKKTQGTDKNGLLLIEDSTGSVWNGLTGKAIRGKLKGKKLESLPVTPSFWFGWVDHYPDTELYPPPRSGESPAR